ncbi:LAMI_0E12222g1_1 [Lachancea mirantina]|uniref:LAMI_0E12222g1_1 n=1 Tax=Lachancea mirantina TaxID=1230905 RepID=A0A1G4JPZ6_9SACH|nr:LAMI_0E12222g1_1 [Lachancea mirantina]
MAENNVKDESTLLEDASTLLMFSKGTEAHTENSGADFNMAGQAPTSRRLSTPFSPSNKKDLENQNISGASNSPTASKPSSYSQVNPLASPGPASAVLLDNIDEKVESHLPEAGHTRSRSSSSFSGSGKGMVAAAALAAAATVPLPLRRHSGEKAKKRLESQIEEHGKTQDEQWPVPQSYIVDPDAGTITCICGYDDDDGFTIQCDHCNRWQHAVCYGIKDIETAPDDYLCCACHPRKLDVKRAKRKQQERKNPKSKRKRKSVDDDRVSSARSSSNDVTQVGSSIKTGEKDVKLDETVQKVDSFLSPKDAFPIVYFPLSSSEYKDKYARLFIETHSDDDWVTLYNKKSFTPLPIEVRPYAESSSSKGFTGFAKLGVFLQKDCRKSDLIEEFVGEIDFKKKYLTDTRNNYRIWGTTKPKVICHPHWPICIDARLAGNLTRYVRRSCFPNIELATVRLGESSKNVKFILKATRDIMAGEELQLGWEWDLRHPVLSIINGSHTVESLPDPDKYMLIHSVDTILGSCECACGSNNKDCELQKVRKYSLNLIKLVKSKMNNRYKLNEILNRAQKGRGQTPILSRMAREAISSAARASEILADFQSVQMRISGKDQNSSRVQKRTREHGIQRSTRKLSLLERHLEKERQTGIAIPHQIASSVTVITNPADFDESRVTDLKALPIPVEIDISSMGPVIPHMDREVYPVGIKQQASSEKLFVGAAATVGDSSLLGNLTATAPQRAPKKKLSFADYKKKQKPL